MSSTGPMTVAGLGPEQLKRLAVRMGVVLAVVGSLVVVWWSLRQLWGAQQETQALATQVGSLNRSVEAIALKWPSNTVSELGQKVAAVEASLVTDEAGLTRWVTELKDQLVAMAWRVNLRFGPPATQRLGGREFNVVPATLELTAGAMPVDSPVTSYQRLLQLQKYLMSQRQRVDLMDLQVSGQSNSVSRAVAMLDVWGTGGAKP